VHYFIKEVLAVKRRIDSKVLLRVVVVPKHLVLRAMSLKKIRKYIEALSNVQIMVNWDIGKTATNILSMEQRKSKKPLYYLYIVCFYFNQLKCLSVLQILVERENQGRTPLRVGFQLKFQHRIGTSTQMKMCSQ
jgi:hypothetical protein